MQAQSIRQQTTVSSKQSLEVIKTLLTASFGCIAYLRNLLPEENFGEGRLLSYGPQESSMDKDARHASSLTLKTVTRGFSTEGDKLLNYLEHGVFDAIERQYLKSFIFAIYLDNNDRNNIVESYTYNLTYCTVPGTAATVPILSLDDQLNKLSLNRPSKGNSSDAVARATLEGKAPTLREVKQSVKSLLKNLILLSQSLEPLPRRRFATFQLLYTENTPEDYEPPYFRPGDPKKDRFVFTTHNKCEVPEKISVGTVSTPYHGIDVQVQSIAHVLPSDERDDSEYLGIGQAAKKGSGNTQGTLDAASRGRQIEAQRMDAETRQVAWNAQDSRWTDEDAEGEDDPDFVNDSGISFKNPIGLRQSDGGVIPMQPQDETPMDIEGDTRFFGKPDVAPNRLGQLRMTKPVSADLEPTQVLDAPEVTCSLSKATERNNRDAVGYTEDTNTVTTIDTQMLQVALDQSAMEWTGASQMLGCPIPHALGRRELMSFVIDLETQAADVTDQSSDDQRTREARSRASDVKSSEIVSCVCEHDDDVDVVFCEACERWLHIRCMGYRSAQDSRLPAKFVCIPCRLQNDVMFHLIKDKYPAILASFVDLALFRRAIKFVEQDNPESLKEFRKLSKCSASSAEQQWNRLEREGFIVLEVLQMDKNGLLEARSRATRSTKKVKSAKQVQKYVFNKAIKKTAAYQDYFYPDSEAEKAKIGLVRALLHRKTSVISMETTSRGASQSLRRRILKGAKHKRGTLLSILRYASEAPIIRDRKFAAAEEDPSSTRSEDALESQTQDETQAMSMETGAADLKRRSARSSEETVRTKKKVRISVVEEDVDIEE